MNTLTLRPLRLGFLASKNGSSLRAVVAALESGALDAEARIVISNNRTAPALAFAEEHGVPSLCIPTQGGGSAIVRDHNPGLGVEGPGLQGRHDRAQAAAILRRQEPQTKWA